MFKFKLGSRVQVNFESNHLRWLNGNFGIVRRQKDTFATGRVYGVEFDFEHSFFHTLNGSIPSSRGYWINEIYLRQSSTDRPKTGFGKFIARVECSE